MTFNTLLEAHAQMGRWQEALVVLDDMQGRVGGGAG